MHRWLDGFRIIETTHRDIDYAWEGILFETYLRAAFGTESPFYFL